MKEEHPKPKAPSPGTGSSNPLRSSGESANLRSLRRRRVLQRELLSAMRFRERNSQLLSLSDAAYAAGLRRIERDLDDPQTPKMRAEHLCFVTVRGDRR
jgi:hypothetical protein